MNDLILVYCTCNSIEQAKTIGKACVQARLAACANILPSMISMYWWDAQIEEAEESILLLKTQAFHFDALKTLISALHSYSNPCIVAAPLTHSIDAYAQWIRDETNI